MIDLLSPITVSVLATCVAFIALIAAALYRGSRLAGAPPRAAARLAVVAGVLLTAGFVVVAAVAATGVFSADAAETVPWLGVGLLVTLVLGLIGWRVPAVARALSHRRVPALLAVVQIFRIEGAVFLVLLAMGLLPAGFAIPAGVGDVLVGLAAPVVAVALWRNPERRALGYVFNGLGLLDLVVAIAVGVSLASGPLQQVVTVPTTDLMGLLPMVLVPTFAVPLAAVLHVVSFQRLAAARQVPLPAPVAV